MSRELTPAEILTRREEWRDLEEKLAQVPGWRRRHQHLSRELSSGCYLPPPGTPKGQLPLPAEDAADLEKAASEAVAKVAPKPRPGTTRAAEVRAMLVDWFKGGEETWTLDELTEHTDPFDPKEVTRAECQAALDAMADEGQVEKKAGRYYWRKPKPPEPPKGKASGHRDTKPANVPQKAPAKAPSSPAKPSPKPSPSKPPAKPQKRASAPAKAHRQGRKASAQPEPEASYPRPSAEEIEAAIVVAIRAKGGLFGKLMQADLDRHTSNALDDAGRQPALYEEMRAAVAAMTERGALVATRDDFGTTYYALPEEPEVEVTEDETATATEPASEAPEAPPEPQEAAAAATATTTATAADRTLPLPLGAPTPAPALATAGELLAEVRSEPSVVEGEHQEAAAALALDTHCTHPGRALVVVLDESCDGEEGTAGEVAEALRLPESLGAALERIAQEAERAGLVEVAHQGEDGTRWWRPTVKGRLLAQLDQADRPLGVSVLAQGCKVSVIDLSPTMNAAVEAGEVIKVKLGYRIAAPADEVARQQAARAKAKGKAKKAGAVP